VVVVAAGSAPVATIAASCIGSHQQLRYRFRHAEEVSTVSSAGTPRTVAGLVLAGLGIALAFVSPFVAFHPDRRGGHALPNARQIHRRFVIAVELQACTCVAIGLTGIASTTGAGGFLFLIGGLSSPSSLFAFLAAHGLYGRSVAAAGVTSTGASPPDGDGE
jgi:hypothetical protein